jgi:hypothetical protein
MATINFIYDTLGGNKDRKKPINSKVKGSSNEIKACKALTKWAGFNFNRTPSSGGLQWKHDQRIVGDIVPEYGVFFPFVVEVKAYKSLDIDFPEIKRIKLFKFFRQALRDSLKVEKEPLLMARQNNMKKNEWYIGFTRLVSDYLEDSFGIKPVTVGISKDDSLELCIFTSDSIFNIPYNEFVKKWKFD